MKVKKMIAVIAAGSAVLVACSPADNSAADGSERSSDDGAQESVDERERGRAGGRWEEAEPAEEAVAVVVELTSGYLSLVLGDRAKYRLRSSEQFFESSPGSCCD